MSRDRFVYWQETQQVPAKEDVGKALAEFLGGFASHIEWKDDRWYATLVNGEWIEVYMSDEPRFATDTNIDVITRLASSATNALADRFAQKCLILFQADRIED